MSKSISENLICTVIDSSATEITCVTPPITDEDVYTGALDVVVQGKLIEEAVCTGTCNFEFTDGKTGSLDVPDPAVYSSGEEVVLTGSGFGNGGAAKVMIGSEEVTASAATGSSITFNVP